jgi:hypothetical protein
LPHSTRGASEQHPIMGETEYLDDVISRDPVDDDMSRSRNTKFPRNHVPSKLQRKDANLSRLVDPAGARTSGRLGDSRERGQHQLLIALGPF